MMGGSPADAPDRKRKRRGTMKRILLIATGGTIASEATEDGLSPALTTAGLLASVPAMRTV